MVASYPFGFPTLGRAARSMKLLTHGLAELLMLPIYLFLAAWFFFGVLGFRETLDCDADLDRLTDPNTDSFTTVFAINDRGEKKMRPLRGYFAQGNTNRFVEGYFVYSVVLESVDLSKPSITAVCSNPLRGEDRVRGSFDFYEGSLLGRTSQQGTSNWNPSVAVKVLWSLVF